MLMPCPLPCPPPSPTPLSSVVSAVQEMCIQRGIAPPTIITESGRALASHHSVLVFDVLTM
jgi:arginine decarboxylase